MRSSDGKTETAEAKKDAWVPFNQQFPNADKSKFVSQATVESKGNVSAEIFFIQSEGSLQSVFGSDRKYWSADMKKALGLGDSGGFPYQLSPLRTRVSLPIPAEPFNGKAPSLKAIFNADMKIYVTLDEYFTTKFREIFQQTKLRHTSAAESKHWSGGPDIKYWPQQLNLAVFCATQGCGVSREIFDSRVDLPPQIRAFYIFHVYFTVRRILYQLGGIQSVSALPEDPKFNPKNNHYDIASYQRICGEFGIFQAGILYQLGGIQSVSALPADPTFNPKNNHYDIASYKRICGEFGIDPTSDFRFTRGANHGMGSIYIWVTDHGPINKFSDEGGSANKGNLISFIEPDDVAYSQADWFAPTHSIWFDAGWVVENQPIDRSLRVLYSGRAGQRQKQYSWLWRSSKRSPK